MPKINKEEYEKIKLLPDYDWNWIAREKTGKILSFTNKPTKTDEVWKDKQTRLWFNYKDSQLFHFIQWEDREPYNIAELIREYEGEKIEVKNIEWLKEEVLGLRNNGNGKTNQTAVEREIGRLQEWAWNNCVDRVYELINRLDEPEVLSQEWIDKNKTSIDRKLDGTPIYKVREDFLQNLLVPKQELPVIPKYVGEWIEENRERYKNTFFSIGYDIYSNAIHPPVDDWIIGNQEKFVRAWFDAYKIEEEPLYYALIKGHELSSDNLKYWHCEAYHLGRVLIGAKHPKQRCINRMTKKNWKIYGINESNADFEEVQG